MHASDRSGLPSGAQRCCNQVTPPAARKARLGGFSRGWLKGKPGPHSTPPHPAPGAALPAYTSTLLYFSGFFIPWDQIPNYWKWCAVPLQL